MCNQRICFGVIVKNRAPVSNDASFPFFPLLIVGRDTASTNGSSKH
jgi:hypothetical protein